MPRAVELARRRPTLCYESDRRSQMNPSTALPTPPAAKASPLINRNFALLFGGVAISSLGDMIFNITLILCVTQTLAHGQPLAPLAVSRVLVAAALPILLVPPPCGGFLGRLDDR